MSSTESKLQDQRNDSIDYILERVSMILLKKQSVSFEKLRRLTILSTTITDAKEYAEIVVLSLIKHLELDTAFRDEIKENKESYRLFNALNLNDDRINAFFVEFIIVLAPELCTALSAVLAQLAIRLAERNKSKYSSDRMARLQNRINTILENSDDIYDEDSQAEDQVATPKPRRKSRRVSFAELVTGVNIDKRIKAISSSSSSSGKKSNSVVIPKKQAKKVDISNLHIYDSDSRVSETASETSERLRRQRKKEKEVVPDTNSDVLPDIESIKRAKGKAIADDDGSSIVF